MRGVKGTRGALLAAVVTCGFVGSGWAAPTKESAATNDKTDAAALFGAREGVFGAKLSPDGQHILYLSADRAAGTGLMIANADSSQPPKLAMFTNGAPQQLHWCDWAGSARVVCAIYMVANDGRHDLGVLRMIAADIDGGNPTSLKQAQSLNTGLRNSQYDGRVIDWMPGETGKVLMERDHVPERDIGTHLGHTGNGLGVDLVDTRSLASSKVEQPVDNAVDYISDGRGVIRIMATEATSGTGMMKGVETYSYRLPNSRQWQTFSRVPEDGPGLRPILVDPVANVAYCFDRKNGRDELYRVALDGTMKIELVYSDPKVDVDDVVRLGRQAKLIGVTTVDEKRQVVYFDKEYEALGRALGKALPGRQLDFANSSADEQTLLLFAGSDTDPGRYYIFDRRTKHLNEVVLVRPALEHVALAPQVPITYRAADGTMIPAYLTMPVNGPKKGLPAIVMPHGGPSARDEWGFDWLPQFFAAQGYAVLQPNYRGSAGYGESWLMKQGFQSWRTAIGDVVDAGHYLVSSGIAALDKLAIVGWSYGGYAALQSNVVDPDLFKAVVAIAPVTDLDALRAQFLDFTDEALVSRQIGTGPHVAAGSPARHADVFKAPVMLFHGTSDLNVSVAESRLMNDRLKAAGKTTTLITYPGLDHPLPSGEIRADMLRRADGFLRTSMHIAN
jgi:dipeptidyl aminopeptidase/acylaminoacyl peptidase